MGVRRKARELALQMLFEHDVAGTAPADMFQRSEDLRNASESAFSGRIYEDIAESHQLLRWHRL